VTSNAHELGSSVGAWNAVVRRARIGRERKAAALVVSSYANADGTGIHCGVARLAVDLEVSYSTARRCLAWLREVGLIEVVRAGNRQRKNLADEYRLILGPDVLETDRSARPGRPQRPRRRPARGQPGGIQGSAMVTRNQPVDNSDCGSPKVTPDRAETAEVCGSSRVTPKVGSAGQIEVFCGSPMGEPPPRLCTSPKDLPPTTTTDDGGLGGLVTLEATRKSEEPRAAVVEIFPGATKGRPHRTPSRATHVRDAIAEASARVAARKAAHLAGQQPPTTTTEVS
jgi:DNA-binding transcriptional ArsR family regulator